MSAVSNPISSGTVTMLLCAKESESSAARFPKEEGSVLILVPLASLKQEIIVRDEEPWGVRWYLCAQPSELVEVSDGIRECCNFVVRNGAEEREKCGE